MFECSAAKLFAACEAIMAYLERTHAPVWLLETCMVRLDPDLLHFELLIPCTESHCTFSLNEQAFEKPST